MTKRMHLLSFLCYFLLLECTDRWGRGAWSELMMDSSGGWKKNTYTLISFLGRDVRKKKREYKDCALDVYLTAASSTPFFKTDSKKKGLIYI
jgi:hypothetical protein